MAKETETSAGPATPDRLPPRSAALAKPLVVALLAVGCCALWGSAVPMTRLGFRIIGIDASQTGSIYLFAGVRFTLAGIVVVLVHAVTRHERIRPNATTLRSAALLSLFQTTGQYLLYYVGLAHATGVSGSIVQGVTVFVALVVSTLVFRMERLTARKVLGCVVGFLGLFVADRLSGSGGSSFTWMGEGLIILSTVSAAISTVLMRRLSGTSDPVELCGWQFFMGGVTLAVVGLALGGTLSLTEPAQVGVLLWLVGVSSVAYSVWSLLLSANDVSRVVVYAFATPIFGVLLSLAILGDEGSPVGLGTAIAVALVCVGITIVNLPDRASGRLVDR